jgi:hypothetical protein
LVWRQSGLHAGAAFLLMANPWCGTGNAPWLCV